MPRRIASIGLILLPWLLVACGGEGAPMLISQQQEITIGEEVARQAEDEYGKPLTRGPQVARLGRVWKRIHAQAKRTVPYRASVLDNDEVINAFACPGGPLYFTTGLTKLMDRDDELAFVVGHEMAHIEHEHGRKAINQALLLNVAASVLLDDAGQLAQFGAGVAFTLYSQGYSRQNEREADSSGLRFMAAAGYQPEASVKALRKLGGGEHRGLDKYLASHPSTPERIRRLERLIATEYGR